MAERQGRNPGNVQAGLPNPKMPKVGGIESSGKSKNAKHIPMVIITSPTEASLLRTRYKSGKDNYIVKPNDYQEFVDACGECGLYWLPVSQVMTD